MSTVIKQGAKNAFFWSSVLALGISVGPIIGHFLKSGELKGEFLAQKLIVGVSTFLLIFIVMFLWVAAKEIKRELSSRIALDKPQALKISIVVIGIASALILLYALSSNRKITCEDFLELNSQDQEVAYKSIIQKHVSGLQSSPESAQAKSLKVILSAYQLPRVTSNVLVQTQNFCGKHKDENMASVAISHFNEKLEAIARYNGY